MPHYVAERSPARFTPTRMHVGRASDAVVLAAARITDHAREHLIALWIDRRLGFIGSQLLTIGSPEATIIDSRQILRSALLADAALIVLAHNHPSGEPTPSAHDLDATARLAAACVQVGLELADHLILTADPDVWVSMRERGHL